MIFRIVFIFIFVISCSSSSNKKLLKESIYIYETKNNAYDSLSSKEYSIDFKSQEVDFNNQKIGNTLFKSFRASKKLKVKQYDSPMYKSNIVINNDYVFFLDSKYTLHKKSLIDSKLTDSVNLSESDDNYSTLNKRIALNKNKISVVIGNRTVYQIDADNLKILWSRELANIVRTSVINDNNNVFVTTIDNVIYALDADSGNIKWKTELDSKQTSIYGSGQIISYNQYLIFSSSLGETVALNKKNGKIIWSDKINLTNIHNSEYDVFDTEFEPIIENGKYYSWTYSGSIISYNISSGTRNWTLNIRPITNLWLIADIIYTVASDNNIIAIDKYDGKIIWHKPVADLKKIDAENYDERNISSVAIINNKLAIISKSGQVVLLDPITGDYLSKKRFAKNIITLPYRYQDNLYLQDHHGNIRIYK